MPASNPVLIQDVPGSRNQKPPLFLIHDASGLLTSYFKIGHLDGRKLYGIWDPKFDQDGIGGWQTIQDIAESYVRLVRRVVMRGEIVLGGWSFGGIIATQMAHILAKQGRGLRVSGIILLDSVYPRCERPEARKPDPLAQKPPKLPGVNKETREKLLTALMRATCISDQWEPPNWSDRGGVVRVLDHGADPAPPPVVLLRASEFAPMDDPDEMCPLDRTRFLPQLGWEDMRGDFVSQVIHTPGNHYTIFDEKNIDAVNGNIKKALATCNQL